MSKPKNDGGPAFPQSEWDGEDKQYFTTGGLSLRDWLAGQAMVGLRSSHPDAHPDWIAKHAYEQADFMLEVREQ